MTAATGRSFTSEEALASGFRIVGAALEEVRRQVAEEPLTDDRYVVFSQRLDDICDTVDALSTGLDILEREVAQQLG